MPYAICSAKTADGRGDAERIVQVQEVAAGYGVTIGVENLFVEDSAI
jgi:hypothetical protein